MLNLDLRFRFFQESRSYLAGRHGLQLFNSCVFRCDVETVREMLPDRNPAKCRSMMQGAVVITKYANKRGSPTFYRIEDVEFNVSTSPVESILPGRLALPMSYVWYLAPESTFVRTKRTDKLDPPVEETISYSRYFFEYWPFSSPLPVPCSSCVFDRQYGLQIRDKTQPLLVSYNKRRRATDGVVEEQKIYLVPELCILAGLTEEMRTNGQSVLLSQSPSGY